MHTLTHISCIHRTRMHSHSAAAFGFMMEEGYSKTLRIIPATLYILAFSIGMGPIPWLVCTELYPSRVRSLAVSLSTVVNWASGFVVTMTFSAFSNALGEFVVLYFYATICLLGCLFAIFILPETKGKSLEEIEQMFLARPLE